MVASLESATTHALAVACAVFTPGMEGVKRFKAAVREHNAYTRAYQYGPGTAAHRFNPYARRQLFPRNARGGAYRRRAPRGVARARPFRRGFDRSGGAFRSARQLMMELKNWDQSFTIAGSATMLMPAGALVASGALGAPLVGLAQGNTQNQRVGRRIRLKSLIVKGTLASGGGATPDDWAVLVLLLDRQSNGAIPAAGDVWSAAGGGAVGTHAYDLARNLDNDKRFKILKSEKFTLQAGAGVAGAYDAVNVPVDWYIKFNMNVEIGNTNVTNVGNITEFKENNLYLCMVSANGTCNLTGLTRVRYYDA